jgi:hypothetical protein
MRVWDRIFATRSRAPLFASCLALLEPYADKVLASSEMGEAIELLQGLGDSMRPEQVDSFIAKVEELLVGPTEACSQRHQPRLQPSCNTRGLQM